MVKNLLLMLLIFIPLLNANAENFNESRLQFIDMVSFAPKNSGRANLLFRGNMPVINSQQDDAYFAYDQLLQAMQHAAADKFPTGNATCCC